MTTFLQINKHKLPFAIKVISLIFTIIVFGIYIMLVVSGKEYPDLITLICVLLGTSIIFPISIIGVAFLEWRNKRKIRNRAYSIPPFNELNKIGFTNSYLNKNSKWNFTEENKEITIDNYLITCDIKRDSPNTILFKTFIKNCVIEKERFKTLETKFKQNDIYFDLNGLIKKYNIKKNMDLTIEQVEDDLNQFVIILKQENFEPDEK